MPDLLTLDTRMLLDQSEVGRDAAAQLEKRWAAHAGKDEAAKALALKELEQQRFMLRKALLERARPVVEQLAKKKKARWVLEAQVVLWGDAEEITKAVIVEVDGQGPLVIPG